MDMLLSDRLLFNMSVSALHLKCFAAKLFLVNMEHISIVARVDSKYYCCDDSGCMQWQECAISIKKKIKKTYFVLIRLSGFPANLILNGMSLSAPSQSSRTDLPHVNPAMFHFCS